MRRLLVANRGEIASRVIRTARRLGVETVAVYSEADRNAPFVEEADQAIAIGPAPARESYLDQTKVLEAARRAHADAVHPGYGFLSENAGFAEAVQAAGLIWVGPPPAAILAMGLKDAAKALMTKAGVPTTPGYLGQDQSLERLQSEAAKLGFPVLIKAVAGGGGKGMRRVDKAEAFAAALASAKREAAASFGDDRVLLEIYVTRPRHIEVQVFADGFGGVVHLFERDCSLQRRHQKVIEEAPAPGMDDITRQAITTAAVTAARAVDYRGAGTVEFIADGSDGLRADRIWFMEMNTRLQVEHPVTEMVTGLDLVEWQLRIAAGQPLPLNQDEIRLNGWAMEARLYAENTAKGFLPSTGPLERLRLPPSTGSVRVDTGVRQGGAVTPYYDPMIAKIIAHGATRTATARTLKQACSSVQVWPVKTNAAFLVRCLDDADFLAGAVDTGFIEAKSGDLTHRPEPRLDLACAAAVVLAEEEGGLGPSSPWRGKDGAAGFRLNGPPQMDARLSFEGEIVVAPLSAEALEGRWLEGMFSPRGGGVVGFDAGEPYHFQQGVSPQSVSGSGVAGDGRIVSPMPGKIVSVGVQKGAALKQGQVLLVLEAMKMEHAIAAPFDGVLTELNAQAGDQVSEGFVLARLEKPE